MGTFSKPCSGVSFIFLKILLILRFLTHGISKLNASKIKERKDYLSKKSQMYGFVLIVVENRPQHVCHDFIIVLFFYFYFDYTKVEYTK